MFRAAAPALSAPGSQLALRSVRFPGSSSPGASSAFICAAMVPALPCSTAVSLPELPSLCTDHHLPGSILPPSSQEMRPSGVVLKRSEDSLELDRSSHVSLIPSSSKGENENYTGLWIIRATSRHTDMFKVWSWCPSLVHQAPFDLKQRSLFSFYDR
ncbi:Ph Domain Leucine-Rich Repeat-Containing Protein Phosphatase 2 [Manis pentadactyla]|nr:Ph Domain Leucine-Rich Repeat-Containing Protein Phosphatase 2 [Manis pentadactyla]